MNIPNNQVFRAQQQQYQQGTDQTPETAVNQDMTSYQQQFGFGTGAQVGQVGQVAAALSHIPPIIPSQVVLEGGGGIVEEPWRTYNSPPQRGNAGGNPTTLGSMGASGASEASVTSALTTTGVSTMENPGILYPPSSTFPFQQHDPQQYSQQLYNHQIYKSLPNPVGYSSYVGGSGQFGGQPFLPVSYYVNQPIKHFAKDGRVLDRTSYTQFTNRDTNLTPSALEAANFYPQQHTPLSQNLVSYRSGSSPEILGASKGGGGATVVSPSWDTTSQAHFKPTKTKRNVRPRINNLNEGDYSSRKNGLKRYKLTNSSSVLAELSTNDVFQHFKDALKIEKPTKFGAVSPYLYLEDELECKLFDLFTNNLSRSLDIFFPQEVYQKIIPELSLYDDTNMIKDSILCLSSLMYRRIKPNMIDLTVTMKFYQRTIKSIRYHLSLPGVEDNEKGIITRCLLSTIFLCIYELFFVAVDSTYAKGAAGILSSLLTKDHQSKSLLKDSPFFQTCFWSMVMYDLILSLKYSLPSMYSIEKFWRPMDPEYFRIYDHYNKTPPTANSEYEYDTGNLATLKVDTMWWIHKSLITLSKIVEFKNQINVLTRQEFDKNKPFLDWMELKRSVDDFESQMPLAIKPTIYKPNSNERLFPLIFFKDESTAIVGLNYKLLKIALLESLLQRVDLDHEPAKSELARFPENYSRKLAKDVVGILKTYDSNLHIWPVNVHTIRQISTHLLDEPQALKGLQELIERLIVVCHLK